MDWSGAAVAAGRIAGAATGAAAGATRADETLEELRALIPYTGSTLGAWIPQQRRHVVVAGAGYRDETADDLNSADFLDDPLGHVVFGRGLPTRWRDLPFAPQSSPFFQRTLAPCGFSEGMAAPLFREDGSYAGLLNVNTDSARHPDDAAVEMVRLLSARFAEVLDAVADDTAGTPPVVGGSEFPEHRVVLSPAGDCTPLDADWTPSEELRAVLGSGVARDAARFLVWERQLRHPWHVWLEDTANPSLPRLVTISQRPVPAGLSRRELEVLAGVADGLTNQQIAARLHSSPRTVSTHVEHILAKLGVRTRTEAATRAHREGLDLRTG